MATVTGTENLMMAATLADGVTTLENAACEPESSTRALPGRHGRAHHRRGDVAHHHRRRRRLHGAAHAIMPDASKTGTFLAAVAATGGDATLVGHRPTRSMPGSRSCARPAPRSTCAATRYGSGATGPLAAVTSAPRPIRFPTEHAGAVDGAATLGEGTATITETIFENRMMHVQELQRLGADIEVRGQHRDRPGVPALAGRA